MSKPKKQVHAYILKVDRENGWKAIPSEKIAQNIDYLRTNFSNFSLESTIKVPKGEFYTFIMYFFRSLKILNFLSLT